MISYGFFNSKDGDRKYNASHLNTLFDGIIQDGVFQTIGNTFAVTPNLGGLSVNIDTGKCWFKNTWLINDSLYNLTFDDVGSNGWSRIDAIVIDINKQDGEGKYDKRENTIKVVKGTAAASPVKPDLIYTDNETIDGEGRGPHYQIPIAWVTVSYGDTTIEAADIENNVGISYETETAKLKSCPFVMGAMQRFTVNQYVQQLEEAFDAWFQDLQNELDENQAAHLQHEIDTLISAGEDPLTSESTLPEGKVYFQYEV